jgi:lipoyl-dependent peroxiredoxin
MTSYTAVATTTGGRNGHVTSSDRLIDFDLSMPKELGGAGKAGATNPEQLFAAGYSACFGSAVQFVAGQEKTHLDAVHVTARVTIDQNDTGFFLAVTLQVKLDGVDHARAVELVEKAHTVCPYSKATHGNVVVMLETL